METFGKITLHNGDCMEVLRSLPDNSFDLAICDPPYGIDFGNYNRTNKLSDGTRIRANKYKNENKEWDKLPPPH